MRHKLIAVEPEPEMNLAPFMNLVMLLIPLLLLSVTFEEVGVLPVSSPRFGPLPSPDPVAEPPLQLRVMVSHEGFLLDGGEAERFAPAAGCGVTICAREPRRVAALVSSAQEKRRRFDQTGDRALLLASDADLSLVRSLYDFDALEARLRALKERFPDTRAAVLVAEPETPYDLLTATMGVVRGDPGHGAPLFDDVQLGVAP